MYLGHRNPRCQNLDVVRVSIVDGIFRMSLRHKLSRLGDPAARLGIDARVDADTADVVDTRSCAVASASTATASTIESRDGVLSHLRGLIRDLEVKPVVSVRGENFLDPSQLDSLTELVFNREKPGLARVVSQQDLSTRYGTRRVAEITHASRKAFETLLRSQHEDSRTKKRRIKLAGLAQLPEDFDFTRILFLDTETTGLAGGTGTIPFLIGIAYFDRERSLHVEQLTLEKPGNELPMLLRLRELLQHAQLVVSYNGKSFDWPLLRTRAVLHRVPLTLPAHLDLLVTTRKIFRARVGSAKLIHIESEVLNRTREDDVHGSQIPRLFWEFVRSEDSRWIAKVVEHNRLDLVALPAVLGLIAEALDSPGENDMVHEDNLGLARVAERAGSDGAILPLLRAASRTDNPSAKRDVHLFEAKIHRGGGDISAEEKGLLDALEAHEIDREFVFLQLAKFYEHRKRDFREALRFAELTVDTKRIARIQRKIATQI